MTDVEEAGQWSGCRLRDLTHRQRRVAVALGIVVSAPFLIAALQALADGWYPIGDDGTMLTVARQVFSAHPPLTGETGSFDRYGIQAFHPGPMVYYLLAPFVAVLGDAAGLAIGAALVSMLAMAGIGYVALRIAGPGLALWAWATALLMSVSLGGTAYLYRPFKAVSALLVILVFLHLSAALASGRSTLLPVWAVAASYPAAASVRYVMPIAGVAVATMAVVAVTRWRRAAGDESPGAWRRLRQMMRADPRERRSLLITLGVLAVIWWAPVYEAVTNDGGNVRQLYRGIRAATGETDGLRVAFAEWARTLVFDPMMSGADNAAPRWPYLLTAALLSLAGVVALVVNRRHLGRVHLSYVVVAASATACILASLAAAPADQGFGAYQIIGAVPVGAFGVFTLGLVATAGLARRRSLPTRTLLRVGVAAVVVLTVLGAVPGPLQNSREDNPWAYAATRELIDQAAPHLQSDGRWDFWLIGGRTLPVVFVGLKAGLEAEGIDTGLNARAPGLGDPKVSDETSAPAAGTVIVMPSMLTGPGQGWTPIATYEPTGRSEAEADRVAAALVEFARETDPRPLDTLSQGLPRLLCPGLAAEPSGFTLDACPAAQEVLDADNPVATLPPAVVALAYMVQFGDITELPLFDGPAPSADLLDAAHASWDDVPLTVYVRSGDG